MHLALPAMLWQVCIAWLQQLLEVDNRQALRTEEVGKAGLAHHHNIKVLLDSAGVHPSAVVGGKRLCQKAHL